MSDHMTHLFHQLTSVRACALSALFIWGALSAAFKKYAVRGSQVALGSVGKNLR
jgi:hypothetical protein